MPALSHWGAEPLADRYRSLRLDRYKAQSFFHHIDTSWPGLQLVNEEPYIFVCHKFITQSECDQLISSFSKSTKQGSSITYAAQEGKRSNVDHVACKRERGDLVAPQDRCANKNEHRSAAADQADTVWQGRVLLPAYGYDKA
eukprot:7384840-Prymnesium_polylepis.1